MLHNQTKVELEDKLNCCGLLDTNATHAQFELDFSTCTAVSSTHQPLCSHSTMARERLLTRDLFFCKQGFFAIKECKCALTQV